jgi:hypothetical protein
LAPPLVAAPKPTILLVAGGLAALLAGCGTKELDSASAAKTISTLVTTKLGVPVKSVSCPGHVKLKAGTVTICQVTLQSGEVEPFSVRQTDGKGNVHIQPMDLLSTAVEKTIVDRLAAQKIQATASCPQHVAIKVGATVVCTATGPKGSSLRITGTITDSIGSYTLRAG